MITSLLKAVSKQFVPKKQQLQVPKHLLLHRANTHEVSLNPGAPRGLLEWVRDSEGCSSPSEGNPHFLPSPTFSFCPTRSPPPLPTPPLGKSGGELSSYKCALACAQLSSVMNQSTKIYCVPALCKTRLSPFQYLPSAQLTEHEEHGEHWRSWPPVYVISLAQINSSFHRQKKRKRNITL